MFDEEDFAVLNVFGLRAFVLDAVFFVGLRPVADATDFIEVHFLRSSGFIGSGFIGSGFIGFGFIGFGFIDANFSSPA